MPHCRRCGQVSEPAAELCLACGGGTRDAALIGAHARAVPRVFDSPDSSHGASSQLHDSAPADVCDAADRFWRWEPDPSQFRLPQLRGASGAQHPAPTAADRDRQFRYAQAVSAAGDLPPFDRRPANPRLSPRPPALAFAGQGSTAAQGFAGLASTAAQGFAGPGLAGPGFAGPGLAGPPFAGPPFAGPGFVGPASTAAPPFAGPGTSAPPWGPAKPASRRAEGITGVSRQGQVAHGHRRPSPPPARPADGTRTGRWVAMAGAGMLGVATVAVVFAGHPAAADRTSLDRHQTTNVPASASLPSASVSSASVPQPTVDGLVTIEPDVVTAPHEAAVVGVVNRYFGAIDGHAYRVFEKLFSPAAPGKLSAAMFRLDYGTTSDSAATLRSIGVIGPRRIDAVVTFTSYQQARIIPTQSSCTAWRISLHLIRTSHGFLLETPPNGYQPSSRSCS
jgi:hypothetical protein